MIHPTRLRLLKQEVEWMSRFAVDTIDELEAVVGTPREGDAPILVQQIISSAVKMSYLLWRFGRRVTDKHGQAEADHLYERLGLSDASPLSPSNLSRLTELLAASTEELERTVNPEILTVTVEGVTYPLRPLLTAIRDLHAELSRDLARAQPEAGEPAAP